jgi:phage tail protein X
VCIILTQASAIERDLYWRLTGHREAVTSAFAEHNPALAHLRDDPAARLRAGLALLQVDQACYYLAVRGWQADEAAGIEAMAMQLHHFLTTECLRSHPK